MGKDDGLHRGYLIPNRLLPEVGAGVDEYGGPAREGNERCGAVAVVAGVS